jgi:hypothetical protein
MNTRWKDISMENNLEALIQTNPGDLLSQKISKSEGYKFATKISFLN